VTDEKKLLKYFNRKLTDKEVLAELHLDFYNQPARPAWPPQYQTIPEAKP
jgi:hypothetical protein